MKLALRQRTEVLSGSQALPIQAKTAFSLTSMLKTSGLKWRLTQQEARAELK